MYISSFIQVFKKAVTILIQYSSHPKQAARARKIFILITLATAINTSWKSLLYCCWKPLATSQALQYLLYFILSTYFSSNRYMSFFYSTTFQVLFYSYCLISCLQACFYFLVSGLFITLVKIDSFSFKSIPMYNTCRIFSGSWYKSLQNFT